MYADIYPCLRLPRRFDFFTYEIPQHLENQVRVGQFVQIPFRKKQVFGVIAALHTQQPQGYSLQPISATLEESPSWSSSHLTVIQNTAKALSIPAPSLVLSFAPSIPKKKQPARSTSTKSSLTPLFDWHSLEEISTPDENTLRITRSFKEKLSLLKSILKKHDGQVLVLTPRQLDAEELAAYLRQAETHTLLWDPSLNKNKQWAQWQQAKESRIIITTRSGVFLPLQAPSCIIIDQLDQEELKSWEASPHYDAREIARDLCKQLQIPLYAFANAPKAEFSLPLETSPLAAAPILLMHHQRRDERFHQEALHSMEDSLNSHAHALVITHSQSKRKTIKCLDCKRDWVCPDHGALHLGSEFLYCPICEQKEAIPMYCPQCHGQRLRGYGLGTEGLAEELKMHFKEVHVVNAESVTSITSLTQPHVIVSTPGLLKRMIFQSSPLPIKHVLLFSPEDLLFLPSFRANEIFYQLIQEHRQEVMDYVGTPLLVQTTLDRDHPLLKILLPGNDKQFLEDELRLRKKFSYPPFSRFITLTLKFTDIAGLQAKQWEITRMLETALNERVLGPFRRYRQKKQYGLSWQIVQTQKEAPNLDKIDKSIYSKAVVDINPEEIL